jgi:hypothetical protein
MPTYVRPKLAIIEEDKGRNWLALVAGVVLLAIGIAASAVIAEVFMILTMIMLAVSAALFAYLVHVLRRDGRQLVRMHDAVAPVRAQAAQQAMPRVTTRPASLTAPETVRARVLSMQVLSRPTSPLAPTREAKIPASEAG